MKKSLWEIDESLFERNTELDKQVEIAIEVHKKKLDTEIKRLLGNWASGLEPVLAFDRMQNFLGLTYSGIPLGAKGHVVLKAWE
jgi:hypothetical protein